MFFGKKERTKVIGFSGVDGSGKSTQVKMLIEYFEKNGITYRVFYGRSKNSIICKKIIEEMKHNKMLDYKKLYALVNYIVEFKLFCIDVRKKLNNQVLILDRTIIDDVVDAAFLISQKPRIPKWAIKTDINIYIYASADTICKRIQSRGEIFNLSEYKEKRTLYDWYNDGNLKFDSNNMTEKQLFESIVLYLDVKFLDEH